MRIEPRLRVREKARVVDRLRADLATDDVADPEIRLVWVQGVTLGAHE